VVRRVSLRAPLLLVTLVVLIALVAIPVLAASPAPTAGGAAASEKPGKGPKASKEPEVAVTLRGVVSATTDAEGKTTYTIAADGKTLELDAGPAWFHGDKHPLKALVGKTVTITGGQSGTEVDVETVDGTRLRAEGRPPWAGGWKANGARHPGWTAEKAARWAAKAADRAAKRGGAAGLARDAGCWPPGKCKDKTKQPTETPDPNGG
jgi:hypothetical protein